MLVCFILFHKTHTHIYVYMVILSDNCWLKLNVGLFTGLV